MLHIQVDGMTIEILCTDLCDFRAKCVRAVSKNVFSKGRPDCVSRRGPCEKSGVRGFHLASKEHVCVQSMAWIGATFVPTFEIRLGPKVCLHFVSSLPNTTEI